MIKKKRLFICFLVMILCLSSCGTTPVEYEIQSDSSNTIATERYDDEETFEIDKAADITENNDKSVNNEVEPVVDELPVAEDISNEEVVYDAGLQKLYDDYNKGVISTDEYVLYQLYNFYGDYRLDSKYESEIYTPIDLSRLIENNFDALSKETLQYFWDKVNLKDIISFGDDETIEVSANKKKWFNNPFVLEVQAAGVESHGEVLDKVIVSENENFVIWYSSSVNNPVTEEQAKSIAKDLENAVTEFEKLTGLKYTVEPEYYRTSKPLAYFKQKKILETHGYDKSYLEDKMQVYIASFGPGSSINATYFGGMAYWIGEKLIQIFETDKNGSILFPYIIINRDALNNMDSLQQVVFHEMFHHMQRIISSKKRFNGDGIISEATANWFSAKTLGVIEGDDFLNEHAADMVEFSDKIFTTIIDEYCTNEKGQIDYTVIGYFLFPYFQLYEKCVDNGITKIIDSIRYSKEDGDGLAYLESQSTQLERINIMKELTFHNLAQEPSKGITLPYNNEPVAPPIVSEIPSDKKNGVIAINGKYTSQLHIDYYRVALNPEWVKDDDNTLNYTFSENDEHTGNLWLSVIGAKENAGKMEYSLIAHLELLAEESDYSLSADTCSKYDEIYFAVSNASMTSTCKYSLNVNMENRYYQMAISVRAQIEDFFNALTKGDVATLKKYSANVNDDYNDDTIYPALDLECMPQILRLLCKDVKYYFSDDMLDELAKDLKNQYENGYNYVYVDMPYTAPYAWYNNEIYISTFPDGTIMQEPVIETEEQALEIIEKVSSRIPMDCYNKLYVVLPKIGSEENISININHILETYMMPELQYDVYFNNGDVYKLEILNEEEYYNNYLILLGQNMAPFIYDMTAGCPKDYVNKAEWDKLEHYMITKNFEGLQNYLLSVLDASDCEELYKAQNEYGTYSDLNDAQKEYVDNCIQDQFDFSVIDFEYTSERRAGVRGGCYLVEYPIFAYLMKNEGFTEVKDEILKWAIENDIKSIYGTDFYSDTSLSLTQEIFAEMLVYSYYPLIGYAKENIN